MNQKDEKNPYSLIPEVKKIEIVSNQKEEVCLSGQTSINKNFSELKIQNERENVKPESNIDFNQNIIAVGNNSSSGDLLNKNLKEVDNSLKLPDSTTEIR